MKLIFSLSILLFMYNVSLCQKNVDEIATFKKIQQQHLALTQYYRWFQVFEIPQNDTRISNHLNILSDNIVINTYSGLLNGKEGMKGFINYVKPWQNSHHIENSSVKQSNDDTLILEADILYQNILPDSTKNNYKLHYSTKLKTIENELPLFTFIELLPTSTLDNPTFQDAYTENRSKSFMYYWLYLMDNLKGNQNKFKELLTTNFNLELPFTERVKNYTQLEDWIKIMQSKISTSLHSPKSFKATNNTDNTISISLDVEWKGIDIKGDKIISEMHYDWILENNLDERFARIKEMKIKQNKPFKVVDKF